MPLPLDGLRVLVTREAEKASGTAREIRARGGIPLVLPCIATVPPADPGPLRAALRDLRPFARVVVTSPTGARVLAEGAAPGALAPSALGGTRLYAVGAATARALEAAGARDVRVPGRQDADGLLALLRSEGPAPGPTLILRAEKGREVVVEGLGADGAPFQAVVAYRTVPASPPPAEVEALRAGPAPEAALFLSPSAVEGFWGILGDAGARDLLAGALVVAIGPVTAAALQARGLPPGLVPPDPDVGAVLDAVALRLRPGLS